LSGAPRFSILGRETSLSSSSYHPFAPFLLFLSRGKTLFYLTFPVSFFPHKKASSQSTQDSFSSWTIDNSQFLSRPFLISVCLITPFPFRTQTFCLSVFLNQTRRVACSPTVSDLSPRHGESRRGPLIRPHLPLLFQRLRIFFVVVATSSCLLFFLRDPTGMGGGRRSPRALFFFLAMTLRGR